MVKQTLALIQVLREPLVYYDKIFIYTSLHQEKMVDFQHIMDNWYHKKPVGYNVLELGNADDILGTTACCFWWFGKCFKPSTK